MDMTHPLAGTTAALQRLRTTLDDPRVSGSWRWTVRQRLAAVRDVLLGETDNAEDGWLTARSWTAHQERNALLMRLASLGQDVLDRPDVEAVREDLRRLHADVSRHLQRLNDLAYDAVELELGGSE